MTNKTITRVSALSLLAGVALTSVIQFSSVAPAAADDYPSWSDVERARKNAKSAQSKIRQIEGLIARLEKELEPLREESEKKGNVYMEAQEKLDDATWEADQLQSKADEAGKVADESAKQAGLLASQLATTGTGDLTMSLILSGDNADDLLYQLGLIDQLSGKTNEVFAKATADRNAAQSLFDQAEVARDALADLAKTAKDAYEEAKKASEAVEKKLKAQEGNRTTLEAQLVSLKQNVKMTEKEYLEGVKERLGSGVNLDAGYISPQGWVRPVQGGSILSPYGYRVHPTGSGGYRIHKGADIAGYGFCNKPIFASSAGRVVYASYGWNGGYGNLVQIDHGNGIETWYAHIAPNGILVSSGQTVDIGQVIAKVGTTGDSTGCHLHLEYRINGNHTDPVPKFRQNGITL